MFLKLTSTVGTFVLPSAGVLIEVAPGSAFTDPDLLMVLSSSSELRALVAGGGVVVNDGVSDLSPTAGQQYLTRLWSQAGDDPKVQMPNVDGVISDTQHGSRSGGALHSDVGPTPGGASGFMSASDKEKTNAIKQSGFVDRTSSTLGMSGTNFQITTGSSYDVWVNGKRHTITTTQQVAITLNNTMHYVYFDVNGNLQVTVSPFDFTSPLFAPVAMVYRFITGPVFAIFDERHGFNRNFDWHKWAHLTIGARWLSGFTGVFAGPPAFSVAQGVLADEDLYFDTGGTLVLCRRWYRHTGATAMAFVSGVNALYSLVGGNIQYDNAGTLTAAGGNNYVCHYVYATNDKDYPIASVIGQNSHANLNNARNEALPVFPGWPSKEFKLLYRVIYRNTGSPPTFTEAADYREVSTGPAAAAVSAVHNTLTGRSDPSCHPASAVELGNVTNDAQIKRAADFDTFAEKTHPAESDLILIEDSADSLNKKKLQLANAAKFTYRIERLGVDLATGIAGGRYLKMRYVFLADEAFVRVYEDGVPLIFGVDWNWNPHPMESGMSLVAVLVDGVEILSAVTPGVTYRLEVDEIPLGVVPTLMLWRGDGEGVSRSNIWYRVRDVLGVEQTLSSISLLDSFGWRATYTGPTVIDHLYADRMGVGWFDKSADIPVQWNGSWWLEVYHVGARGNQNKLGSFSNSSRMNSCLVPVVTTQTNAVDLTAAIFRVSGGLKPKGGHYVVRLRDRATNRVTQFSAQTMYLKRFGIRSDDYSTSRGFYDRSGVK